MKQLFEPKLAHRELRDCATNGSLDGSPIIERPMHMLSRVGIAIKQRKQTHGLAFFHELASHFKHDDPSGGMPGKMVGAGWLYRADLLDVIRRQLPHRGLMLVHVCRELKPVYGLFTAQLLRKLEKAQQAASDSMSNE